MRRSPDQTSRNDVFPISLSELGRRCGRAKSSITEAVQGPLAAARLPSGRINARHPLVTEWAVARGIDPALLTLPIAVTVTVVPGIVRRDATRAAPAPGPQQAAPTPAPTPAPTAPPRPTPAASKATKPRTPKPLIAMRSAFEDPPDPSDLLDMTLRDIVHRFGSLTGFADYVSLRKVTADCTRLELANAETSGALIDREFVRVHVIGLIGSTYRRLLTDAPQTIAQRVYAAVAAGSSLEEVKQLVRELLSAQLGGLKENATRALRPIRKSAEDAA